MIGETAYPIRSEAIEPTAAHIIGRLFAQSQEAKAVDEFAYRDALANLWWAACALNSLGVACRGATHFSIASANEMRRVAQFVRAEIGIDPLDHPQWKFR